MKYIILCLLSFYSLISFPGFVNAFDQIPVYTVPGQCNHYVYEVEKYPWDTAMVIKIMKAESGCNPKAINWSDHHQGCDGSFNVLQVACSHYKAGESKKDPLLNIRLAYELYTNATSSFRDWSTCKQIKGCK